ncbi:MAG TPA: hypothetical protein VL947_01575 [Cytophagales bacterium]|nr:hypothetical protein [Cytophagales bacterium]
MITYSWTGDPAVDGCGSLLYRNNGDILVPQDEKQIPDSIRYFKSDLAINTQNITVYQTISVKDSFRCGFKELKKASVGRIQQIMRRK